VRKVGRVLQMAVRVLSLGLFWLPGEVARALRRRPAVGVNVRKRPPLPAEGVTANGGAPVNGNGHEKKAESAAPDGHPERLKRE
jgi:hypothetical protein